jgi:hypothetical protein
LLAFPQVQFGSVVSLKGRRRKRRRRREGGRAFASHSKQGKVHCKFTFRFLSWLKKPVTYLNLV